MARRLPQQRFCHVMGVEGLAVALACRHGLDAEGVLTAALLHDYAKAEPQERLRELMEQGTDYKPTEEDLRHPAMWHGIAAAHVGRSEYGIDDLRVLEAVAYHTTGNEGLGPIGLALYVADYLEPTRGFNGVEQARREILTLTDLRQAALEVARRKIDKIQRKNQPLHGRTLAMARWLERETGKK
ncbi:bis(5'-nucleosyl)-tetraphosphatase (symmetrical) YqeK [Candidatus Sumerlaeota bacterium]|nr:bis(5'-nucleosyl)-tetraphosphatase (symmetrical) YqeK [Candidatus Sumerlaeota bacterium]